MQFEIKTITPDDRGWITDIIGTWLADYIITRGRKVYPAELEGFYAVDDAGEKIGLLTLEIVDGQCEVVTLDAFKKFSGVGTALMERANALAKERECRRLWLITTNDNLEAIRFYQRRDMTLAAIHVNALAHSRTMKPSIPEIGLYGIPMRDEIEFEMML